MRPHTLALTEFMLQALQVMEDAGNRRSSASTNMNEESSRSHLLVRCLVNMTDNATVRSTELARRPMCSYS